MRMLIALALAAAALPASPSPAAPAASHAPGVEDPRAFVQAVYDAYRAGPGAAPEYPASAYSPRLRLLFDAYEAWAARHDDLVGSLDFDWRINAQDLELGPVEISEEAVRRDRRTVVAHFTNAGRRDVNRFHFIRQRNRWYLDDVVNGDGHAHGWVLSELLRDRWK